MQDTTSNNKRIAKNTIMLYIRMFISMLVGLYTSRVVLATLGVEDYGIYGVVGGVVGMMGFLNASMSGATSRFLTFELGKGDKERLAKTFSSALIVHIGIAIVVLILAETVGLWFLSSKLNIPAERMQAAHWVYQLSILSAMFGITQVPYNAAIIAHEKMDVYAYVEILNVSLKLLLVYLLCIGNFDKLILYASLMLAVSILIMMVYRIYAIRQFPEAHFHWIWDKTYLRPMMNFSGWDLYGNMCVVARQQGNNFLVNIFYGVVFNAASSIATTINGVIKGLVYSTVTAVQPQIIKSYSQGNYKDMENLVCNASLYIVLLFGCAIIPVLLDIGFVLKMWLGIVPQKADIFCKIMILSTAICTVNVILGTCLHATGNIKRISFHSGTLFLISLLPVYFFFKQGMAVEMSYWTILFFDICVTTMNLYNIKKQIPELNILKLVYTILKPIIIIAVLFPIPYLFYVNMGEGFLRLLIISMVNVMDIALFSFFIILSKQQRILIVSFLKSKIL